MPNASLPWPGHRAARVPDLPPERFQTWCQKKTQHDQRLAEQAGRPMTQTAARRLVLRRLNAGVLA